MAAEPKRLERPDYRRLFEASPHPYLIFRADPAFTIVAVNDRYQEATGTRRSDLLGRGMFEVFPENPYDSSVSCATAGRTSWVFKNTQSRASMPKPAL